MNSYRVWDKQHLIFIGILQNWGIVQLNKNYIKVGLKWIFEWNWPSGSKVLFVRMKWWYYYKNRNLRENYISICYQKLNGLSINQKYSMYKYFSLVREPNTIYSRCFVSLKTFFLLFAHLILAIDNNFEKTFDFHCHWTVLVLVVVNYTCNFVVVDNAIEV